MIPSPSRRSTIQYPLLAALLRVAAANNGRLSILDFGGSLGSSYFQSRAFLSPCAELRWNVIEQRCVCRVRPCRLRQRGTPLLLHNRGVLTGRAPRCPTPFRRPSLLPSAVCVSRGRASPPLPLGGSRSHALHDDGSTRLTVEHVPAWIYRASYPAWFLSEKRFLACFESEYQLVARFAALDDLQPQGGHADTRGHIFQLADPAAVSLGLQP